MRTLPSTGRARGPNASTAAARKAARRTLLGLLCSVVVVSTTAADPVLASRWVYRATILARGGTFEPIPGALLQSGPADCGPAALATLLVALGGDLPDTARIGRLAGSGATGTTFAGLSRAARLLGVPNRLARLDPASLVDLSSPILAWVDRGHFVTLVPDSSERVLVLDPLAGSYRLPVARLHRFWSGEALVPEPVRTPAAAAQTTPHGPGGTP